MARGKQLDSTEHSSVVLHRYPWDGWIRHKAYLWGGGPLSARQPQDSRMTTTSQQQQQHHTTIIYLNLYLVTDAQNTNYFHQRILQCQLNNRGYMVSFTLSAETLKL